VTRRLNTPILEWSAGAPGEEPGPIYRYDIDLADLCVPRVVTPTIDEARLADLLRKCR
jgi:hypothetical protein